MGGKNKGTGTKSNLPRGWHNDTLQKQWVHDDIRAMLKSGIYSDQVIAKITGVSSRTIQRHKRRYEAL